MTEIQLTPQQVRELTRRDEQEWALAQKLAEVGEFGANAANRIQEALRLGGYEAPARETFMGTLSLAVTIAKAKPDGPISVEEMLRMVAVLYRGMAAAIPEAPEGTPPPPAEPGQ